MQTLRRTILSTVMLALSGCGVSLLAPSPAGEPRTPVGYQPLPASAPAVPAALPAMRYNRLFSASDALIDMKLLVIATSRDEVQLQAIQAALEGVGVPYDLHVATEAPGTLTPAKLAEGSHGFYQGVILTRGVPSYFDGQAWRSALEPAEWEALWAYEAAFGVRQVTWYTYPTEAYGFGPSSAVDTMHQPVAMRLTPDGSEAFRYLAPDGAIEVQHAYTYLARAQADGTTLPLLTDSEGHALALVKRYPDGRENLAFTFDSNPYLRHTQAISYGAIDWLTRGLFLGQRQTYMSAHVDDFFHANHLWGGGEYRMDDRDLQAVVRWQQRVQALPVGADFKLDLVFNGAGATGYFDPDPLTPAALELSSRFKWVNHTYSHLNLDQASWSVAKYQIEQNQRVAKRLKLPGFDKASLVTGEVSGLRNPEAMSAAYEAGVRFVVSDSSRPGEGNPAPNEGRYNWVEPRLYMIPRRPTNMFYNVSTPGEWLDEYNHLYRAFWGRDLSYEELLEKESELLVGYLMQGELNPWMFHQANLRAYDGNRTLLGDLLDRTLEKYQRTMRWPILSPTMADLGQRMVRHMDYRAAGVKGQLRPGKSISLQAERDAFVPVTGLDAPGAERYGGVPISLIKLDAGKTVTLFL